MKACAKLLGLCPEVLTGWNYRRETVEARESEREQATVAEGDAEAEASTSDDWWYELGVINDFVAAGDKGLSSF